MFPTPSPARRAWLLLLPWALSGCATPGTLAQAWAPVAQGTQRQLGQPLPQLRTEAARDAAQARVRELLTAPLSADDAVQIALLNHRGLQAHLAELDAAHAGRVQAGLPPNPALSLGGARRGGATESRLGVELPLGRWLALPWSVQAGDRHLAQVQTEALQQVLALAHETRRAHVVAVAAVQTAQYQSQVQLVADSAAELARRLRAAGHWSALAQAREEAFAAESALGLAQSRQAEQQALEKLARCLGLDGGPRAFTLPPRLPELPAALPDGDAPDAQALSQRLDLQAARANAEAAAAQLGLTRRTRFVNLLDLGATRVGSNQDATERGVELRFELPLFDWGESRVAQAEALYMQAVHRAADLAVQARSELRLAHAARRHRFEVAQRYRSEIVPLRKRIADEQLRRHNGMLGSVFELLADARLQIDAVRGAIDATRDFWLAQADLDQALTGKAPTP